MELKSAVIGDAQCDPEGGSTPPCTGLAPDVLPEVQPSTPAENSQTGVSTNYVQPTSKPLHWYVLRATYGRVKTSYEYLAQHGVEVYHPTIKVYRMVNGKRKKVEESRLPNIFFAKSTEEILKTFVYDNANLPHLRFYCRRVVIGDDSRYEPLIVPKRQM